MGRAGRQGTDSAPMRWTENHPDRHLWTPEQEALARTMSESAYEALYGRGEEKEKSTDIFPSRVLPSLEERDWEGIRSGRIRPWEILPRSRLQPSDFPEALSDPIWDVMWQGEITNLERERQEYEKIGIDHWYRPQMQEEMKAVWKQKFIRSWFYHVPGKPEPWQSDKSAENTLSACPTSALSAALESGQLRSARYMGFLGELRSAGKLGEYFEKEILPEMNHLVRPLWNQRHFGFLPPSKSLGFALWSIAGEWSGSEHTDLVLAQQELHNLLPEELRNQLRRCPIAPGRSALVMMYHKREPEAMATLHGEAFARAGYWQGVTRESAAREMYRAASEVLGEQLVRMYWGDRAYVRNRGREIHEEWKERAEAQSRISQRIFRRPLPPSPIERLRPVFEGEGREDLLRDLVEICDREISQGHFPCIEAALERGVFVDRVAGEGFSEQIFRAVSRATQPF